MIDKNFSVDTYLSDSSLFHLSPIATSALPSVPRASLCSSVNVAE